MDIGSSRIPTPIRTRRARESASTGSSRTPCAPIVRVIFEDYCVNGLGLGAIREKLNRDLERYPPPTRNKKDENALSQTWSRSQIQAMLRNPKYTGFNVWGRHDKRRGRPFIRPREQWIWSAEPTHEALIPKELFDLVEERAARNEHQAKLTEPKQYIQRSGGRSARLYPLRGRVRCALCGRPDVGQPPEGLQLVPLPVRRPARPGCG
jgi:site-specific DNA recombinase